MPVLERLTGTPWPESAETDVIEASTPYLRGYAGYYYADDDVIEVGEDLDSHTMLHELSHAWFNDTYARRALAERGAGGRDRCPRRRRPRRSAAVSPTTTTSPADVDRSRFRLNAWSYPLGDSADAD